MDPAIERSRAASSREHQVLPLDGSEALDSRTLLPRDGVRLRRPDFPEVSCARFDLELWNERRAQTNGGANGAVSSRARLTPERASIALRIFDHVRELAESRCGLLPTIYDVTAALILDPDIGGLGSHGFRTALQLMREQRFCAPPTTESSARAPLFWRGQIKNLHDAAHLSCSTGTYRGCSVLEAAARLIAEGPTTLHTAEQIASALGLTPGERRARCVLNPALQLLAVMGQAVRHPDHVNGVSAISVWSSASYRWRKPTILNPDQAVLDSTQHGGWIYTLYGNSGDHPSPFSNHAIFSAAARLGRMGLITLTKELDADLSPDEVRPCFRGKRFYRARLTEQGRIVAGPWCKLLPGGLLTRDNYEELRRVLVNREKV